MSTGYVGNNWIDQLSDEVQTKVKARMSNRRVSKGEVIYHQGRVHSALWQILSGTVKVTNQTAEGKEVIFTLFTPGDCFGELSLIDGAPATNTAIAVDHVELAELSKSDFDELFETHTELSRQVASFLTSRVRHMLAFYTDVTLFPLEQRIARRILYISGTQFGIENRLGNLQFTQQDLAAMVGATRPAVSKVLNQWRGQGVIALEYGKISVLLLEQLKAIAGEI